MKQAIIFLLALPFMLISASFAQKRFVPRFPPSEELLTNLNSYHTDNISGISPSWFKPSLNVNDSVKRKLLSLLKHEWTDAEVKVKVDNSFREHFEDLYFNRVRGNAYLITEALYNKRSSEISKKSKQDTASTVTKQYHQIYDSVYWALYDSLGIIYKKEIAKNIRESIVPDEIVLSIAAARIYEAIPILQNALATASKYYNKEATELALAALGNQECQKKIFDYHKQYINAEWNARTFGKDLQALALIRTQESVSLLADWMDTAQKTKVFTEGYQAKIKYYTSYMFVYHLFRVISNDEFWNGYIAQPQSPEFSYSPETITTEQVLFCRNWIINNKGRYKFW